MKLKLKSMPHAIAIVIASGALSVAVMSPAMAQADAPAATQRVVVTGSLISRADKETPTPVQILTAADIQKSGKTSVAELLTDLAANGAGTLGTGFSGAFANGAAGISLRGLTVGATLVLVDGHRLAAYPLSDDSQRSFVDVSSIPFDAIETIEVLKSGASSLYGSDAIAGVINIKLKKNLSGTRLSAEAGDTSRGGGMTKRASFSTGFGDLDADGYNAFFTTEWRSQKSIKVSEREGYEWADRDWRSRGGNNLTLGVPTNLNSNLVAANSPFLYNPSGAGGANNAANFQFLDPSKCNYTLYRAGGCSVRDDVSFIQPESRNVNLLVGFTKKLGNDWEVSLKGSMFKRDSSNNRGVPPTFSARNFAGTTTLVNGVLTPGVGAIADTSFPSGAVVGIGQVNNLPGNARLYGYIPQTAPANGTDNTSKTTRFAVDLTGSAFGWDISAAAGTSKVTIDAGYSGYVDRATLYTELRKAVPTFNVLGNNTPAMMAAVSPLFNNTLTSEMSYADLIGARELMKLGAGPLSFAAGVHWHKKDQDAPPSSLTLNGKVANTSAFTIGNETNTAAFAELRANPIKDLEMGVSARFDHYDTYGNSFTPSANFKWAPSKMIALRGTFAKGFRAPNAAEVGNAGSFFTFNAIDDPVLCSNGNINTAGNIPSACGLNPPYVQTTNPALEPEKSTSYTLGMILEPVKGLNLSLDYYNIEIKNLVVTRAGNDPTFVPTWVRGPATPIETATGLPAPNDRIITTPSVGPIVYAESPYINAGLVRTHGIEADIRYKWRLPSDMGSVSANLSAAHTFGYVSELGSAKYQMAGTQGPSSVGGATGNPKDRAQFTLGYAKGPLDVTTTVNYTSGFSTFDSSLGETDCATTGRNVGGRAYFQGLTQPDRFCRVQSFTTTNLNVQYKISQNLTLRAAVLNLFDKEPPFDVATYGNAGAQTSYNASLHQAGAVGRFYSLGMNYKF
ncbi:MAG: TonB-dependent receptor [Pseudomonadota bacterium]